MPPNQLAGGRAGYRRKPVDARAPAERRQPAKLESKFKMIGGEHERGKKEEEKAAGRNLSAGPALAVIWIHSLPLTSPHLSFVVSPAFLSMAPSPPF